MNERSRGSLLSSLSPAKKRKNRESTVFVLCYPNLSPTFSDKLLAEFFGMRFLNLPTKYLTDV